VSNYIHSGTEDVVLVVRPGSSAYGQLVRDGSGNPLPGKTLRVRSGFSVGDQNVQTDAEGWFFIPNLLAPGEYTAELDDNDLVLTPETEKFHVAERSETSDLVLVAVPGGIVSGRVFDEESAKGIAGVEMRISSPPPNTTKTDADGRYRFARLRGGTYEVRIGEVEGYPRFSQRHQRERQVTARVAAEVSGIDFSLYRGLRISGIVLDEEGKPVPNAWVNGYAGPNPTAQDSVQSDAQGRFTLAGYPPNVQVEFNAGNDGMTVAERTRVKVEDRDVSGVRLELITGGTISGVVVDSRGRPLSGLQLYARMPPPDNRGGAIHNTNPDGSFTIRSLAPGEYDIFPYGRGESNKSMHRVTLAKGQNITGLRIVLQETGLSIAGVVVDAEGKPISRATIQTRGHGWNQIDSDAEGRFNISGLAEGEFSLSAYHYNYSPTSVSAVAGTQNVRITLEGKAKIEGHVISANNGQPITDFQIAHKAGAGSSDIYVTDQFRHVSHPDGAFSIEDANKGSRQVMIKADGYTMGLASVENLRPAKRGAAWWCAWTPPPCSKAASWTKTDAP
jgi:protocatechuate 3,4-dioxygenase beta subunit